MNRSLRIDLFCEDRAHEELLHNLVRRLCAQEGVEAEIAIRSARGGHGRALRELELYQKAVAVGGVRTPDLLVVAIDTNCRSYRQVVKEVEARIGRQCFPHYAIACPNPHIELWYMADPEAFEAVIGAPPPPLQKECGKETRNTLKKGLADSLKAAGHPVVFGGIQFAPELAQRMDLYSAAKADTGLRHFLRDVTNALRQLKRPRTGSPPPES